MSLILALRRQSQVDLYEPGLQRAVQARCGYTVTPCLKNITLTRASKMTQWIKVFAVKPGDPNSILGTHMVEGENCLLQVVL